MVKCYVDIGSSCDANGVQVEITHMELETNTFYNRDTKKYEYYGCFDTINFTWLNKDGESAEKTDPQCGCLGENHTSCDEHPFEDDYITVTENPTQYNLVGTNVKLVLQSDSENDGPSLTGVKLKSTGNVTIQ